MAKNSFILIIVLIIAGGSGFYGGMLYQKSQRVTFSGFGGPGGKGMSTRLNNGGPRPLTGEIVSIDENTMTLKTQDGSSKIITYSAATKINKTSEGSFSDLKQGEQVMVIGSESNGAVSAKILTIF